MKENSDLLHFQRNTSLPPVSEPTHYPLSPLKTKNCVQCDTIALDEDSVEESSESLQFKPGGENSKGLGFYESKGIDQKKLKIGLLED